MICSAGQPEEQPDPEKITVSASSSWVWNCESGDRIKKCDGACIHPVDSVAEVGGWSITNVAAFPILRRTMYSYLLSQTARICITFRPSSFVAFTPRFSTRTVDRTVYDLLRKAYGFALTSLHRE